jgi:REP element-mobilizing transposase RayT
MPYDPERHGRRSIRLPGYDYSQPGAYFVTINTQHGICLFGEVVDGEMVLSQFGEMVHEEWARTVELRPYVRLDGFIVMPNHVHGIIWIVDDDSGDTAGHPIVGATRASPLPEIHHPPGPEPTTHPSPLPETNPPRGPKPGSLGAIVGSFKSAVTKRINELRRTPGASVWQRYYFEHIIRNEQSLERIRDYVAGNPTCWEDDPMHPSTLESYGPTTTRNPL